jgi:hypothetical protein
MIKNTEENSQIKNRIDDWLLSKVDNKNQKAPILQLADRVLKNYKREIGNLNPPIDLNDLGECLDIKVKKILLSKNINCDALLIPVEGGFKIKLKNEDKLHYTYRTRYSCAHEMVHTFFYEIEDGGVPFRAVSGGSEYEEKLCEQAAAELLMPKEVLEKKGNKLVNKHGYSFSTLIKLKETFKTSLHSVSIQAINSPDSGWEDYLIGKWTPIFENNKTMKIIGFEKGWEVSKNMDITLPKRVYETEPIFDIFKEMMDRGKISKYIYENDFYLDEIKIAAIFLNGYGRNISFLIMVPINEYFKTLQYSDFDGCLNKKNALDFNFEKRASKRQKMTMTKEKKDLVDFM